MCTAADTEADADSNAAANLVEEVDVYADADTLHCTVSITDADTDVSEILYYKAPCTKRLCHSTCLHGKPLDPFLLCKPLLHHALGCRLLPRMSSSLLQEHWLVEVRWVIEPIPKC